MPNAFLLTNMSCAAKPFRTEASRTVVSRWHHRSLLKDERSFVDMIRSCGAFSKDRSTEQNFGLGTPGASLLLSSCAGRVRRFDGFRLPERALCARPEIHLCLGSWALFVAMGFLDKADRSASSDTTWISCGCILNEFSQLQTKSSQCQG